MVLQIAMRNPVVCKVLCKGHEEDLVLDKVLCECTEIEAYIVVR